MGLFDSIGKLFGGGGGGGGGWGDWLDLAGKAFGIYSDLSAGEAADDAARKQADEYERAAKANAQLSLYDSSVARKDAMAFEQQSAAALAIHMQQVDKVLGAARARLGKTGVSVSEGSALAMQTRIISEGERDALTLMHNGRTGYERRMSAARRYEMLAEKGLRDAAAHASLIESAGRSEQIGHYWSAAGRGAEFVESLGRSEGWW
jgi:hypothetical protein